MLDQFKRKINYLRISVTDLCNFRCLYCMPEQGVVKLDHKEIMTFEEIVNMVKICAELGIKKVRITGGEPLVRKNIVNLIRQISQINGIEDIGITTNGSLLGPYLDELEEIGLKRINFSLDSLKKEKFELITRGGNFKLTMENLNKAMEKSFKIKINCVLIPGFNSDEIGDFIYLTKDNDVDIRFIELMPMGPAANFDKKVFDETPVIIDKIRSADECGLVKDREIKQLGIDGVSEIYQVEGYKGRIGLIRPMSHKFCSDCNRIRLTADGKIKPCLHSATEINIKGLEGEELKKAIESAIFFKPHEHMLREEGSLSHRNMNMIGG